MSGVRRAKIFARIEQVDDSNSAQYGAMVGHWAGVLSVWISGNGPQQTIIKWAHLARADNSTNGHQGPVPVLPRTQHSTCPLNGDQAAVSGWWCRYLEPINVLELLFFFGACGRCEECRSIYIFSLMRVYPCESDGYTCPSSHDQ